MQVLVARLLLILFKFLRASQCFTTRPKLIVGIVLCQAFCATITNDRPSTCNKSLLDQGVGASGFC